MLFGLKKPQKTTVDWTPNLRVSLNTLYPKKITEEFHALEIGSFEGKGTLLIHEHLLQHPKSTITCIDPLDDVYVKDKQELDCAKELWVGQYGRFMNNTIPISNKLILHRDTSTAILDKLEDNKYDFIYVDGDHSSAQVYYDICHCFSKCKVGGIILFDDYLWVYKGDGPKKSIDRFIEENKEKVQVIFSNYQLAIKRVTQTQDEEQYASLPVLDTIASSHTESS